MNHAYVPSDPRPVGDLTFFADFENASSDFRVSYESEAGAYEVAPYSWMHFGVDGVEGKRPTFRVDQPDHVDERRQFVRSPDGREWSYFEDVRIGDDRYAFAPADPFQTDRVFVAGLFPYRLSDLERLLCDLRKSRYVRDLGPRGYSPGRRPLYGLEITDPDVPAEEKHDVVFVAGQHAWEAWGRQVFHGFLETVTSDEHAAQRLRQKAVVHAYPMANPDGVTLGHMRDGTVDHNPNRAWVGGAPPETESSPVPEVDVLRRTILEDTGGAATYFIDFHSHAGWYDRFMWYADGDDPKVRNLVEAIHRADGEGHDDAIVGTETVGGAPNPERRTSKRWAETTLGATGLTFEATPYRSPSMERYRRAGDAFVAGLAAVLE